MVWVWVAGFINIPLLMVGMTLALQMRWQEALIALFVGQFVVSLFISFSAYIGAKSRLPTGTIIPHTFGSAGAIVAMVLVGLCVLGWFGFQTEVFAQSIQKLLFVNFGWQIPTWPFIFGGGILMSTTAIVGFKALDWLSRVTLPLMFFFLFAPLIFSLWENGWGSFQFTVPENPLSLGIGISIMVGAISIGMFVIPDLMRYTNSPASAVKAIWISSFFFAPIVYILAMGLVYLTGAQNFIDIMLTLGWGSSILILTIFSTWTTNDTNLYVSSLAWVSVFKNLRKWQLAVIGGVIGTSVATFGVINYFIPWLVLLGVVFAPASGVLVVDFFMNQKRYDNAHRKQAPVLRPLSMLCWVLGIFTGYLTTPLAEKGLGLLSLTSIPVMDGLLVAGVLMAVFNWVRR
jgi:cytosine permease